MGCHIKEEHRSPSRVESGVRGGYWVGSGMSFGISSARRINQPTAVKLRLERTLLILAVLLLAFAFPFQVLAGSPFPSLLPYAVLGLAFVIRIRAGYGVFSGIAINRLTLVDWWVSLYGFLFVAHLVCNFAIGSIGLMELGSNVVNFLLPLSFYLYFRLFPNGEAIKSVMIGVVIASVMIAGYSVVHAFLKMLYWPTTSTSAPSSVNLFNVLEWFQHAAADYSRLRMNEGDDFSKKLMRYYGPRSSGLLESHSVSAAWIAFGMFGALGLIGQLRRSWLDLLVGSIFLGMLLIFQYYTAIFAAAISLLIIVLPLPRNRLSVCAKIEPKSLVVDNFYGQYKQDRLIAVLIFFICFGFAFAVSVNDNYLANIETMLSIQLNLIFGSGGYVILVLGKFHEYMQYLKSFPCVALFGDGMGIYYPYSFNKGSDIGIVESMARLGIPMLVFVLTAVVTLVYRMLLRKGAVTTDGHKQDGLLTFAVGIMVYVVINDAHYSIWPTKSIFPILMMVCALCCMPQDESK